MRCDLFLLSVLASAILLLACTEDCSSTKHHRRHKINKPRNVNASLPALTRSQSTLQGKQGRLATSQRTTHHKDESQSHHPRAKSVTSRTYVANPFDQLGDLLGINGAFIPTKDRKGRVTKSALRVQRNRYDPHAFEQNEMAVKKSRGDRGPLRDVVIPEPPDEAREISEIMNDKRPFFPPRSLYTQQSNPMFSPFQAMYRYQGPLRSEVGPYDHQLELGNAGQRMAIEESYGRQPLMNREQRFQPPFDNGAKAKQFVPNMEYNEVVPVNNVNPLIARFNDNEKPAMSHLTKEKEGENMGAMATLTANSLNSISQSVAMLQSGAPGKKGEYSHDLIKKLQLDPTWDYVEANLANQAGNHPRINSPASGNAHQNKIESAMEPPEGTPIGKPYVPETHTLAMLDHAHLAGSGRPGHPLQGAEPGTGGEMMNQQLHQTQTQPGLDNGGIGMSGVGQNIKPPWSSVEIQFTASAQPGPLKGAETDSQYGNEGQSDFPSSSETEAAKITSSDSEKEVKLMDKNREQDQSDQGPDKAGNGESEEKDQNKGQKEKGKAIKIKHVAKSVEDKILDQLASAGLDKIVKEFTGKLKKIKLGKEGAKAEESAQASESGADEATQDKGENKVQGEDAPTETANNENNGEQGEPADAEKTESDKTPDAENTQGGKESPKIKKIQKGKARNKDLTANFVKFLEDMAGKLKVDKLKVAEQLVKDVEKAGKNRKEAKIDKANNQVKEEERKEEDARQEAKGQDEKSENEGKEAKTENQVQEIKGQRQAQEVKGQRQDQEVKGQSQDQEVKGDTEEQDTSGEKQQSQKEQSYQNPRPGHDRQESQGNSESIQGQGEAEQQEQQEEQHQEQQQEQQQKQTETSSIQGKKIRDTKAGKQELVTLDNKNYQDLAKPVANLLSLKHSNKMGLAMANLLPLKRLSAKLLQEGSLIHHPTLKNAFLKHAHVAGLRRLKKKLMIDPST